MKIHYQNPGFGHSVESILLFQTGEESPFWSEPLRYFYPQLNWNGLADLPAAEKRQYLTQMLAPVYAELQPELDAKAARYNAHFAAHQPQIEAALSDAFELDANALFNDLVGNITLNPICPRFLRQRTFDLFYKSSEAGALGLSLHEVVHYFWFWVWHRHFGDSYEEYESPSLQWILSEMVVEALMSDPRLSSLNPYYPRENGGCVYPYFQTMQVEGAPVLQTLAALYKEHSITDFMEASYALCRRNEAEIRRQIAAAEASF